jgi:hypothetical protein
MERGKYNLLSNFHGNFPKYNHKSGSAPIATIILRARYKMHPPLSIDSFMLDIAAFGTFYLRAFSCQYNDSFGPKYNKECDLKFILFAIRAGNSFDHLNSIFTS